MSTAQPVVVLLEPEQAISDAVEFSLRAAGFSVFATTDGEDALRIVEKENGRIDAVLAEASMPGVGGRDIAEVLAEYRPEVPVMIISGGHRAPGPVAPYHLRPLAAPIDASDTLQLVAQLQATIERFSEAQRQPEKARRTTPLLLQEDRRLRAEHAGLVAAVRAVVARRLPSACPQCASSRVAPILYGSERVNRRDELAAGHVVLGGAWRAPDDPSWYCRDCDRRWGG